MSAVQLGIIVAVVVLLCAVVLIVPRIFIGRRAPQSSVLDLKDRLSAENDMRTLCFQAITALVLIVGAGLTIRQLSDNDKATQHQLALTQSQLQLAKNAQAGSQFTEEVGQLSAKGPQHLPERIGAIYGLTQLAEVSPDFRSSIFDVLVAYVQASAPRLKPTQLAPDGPLKARDPSLQKALESIGGVLADHSGLRTIGLSLDIPDAASLYLGQADFSSGSFIRADLELDGLDGAIFAQADVSGACFLGSSVEKTNFRGADLRGATFIGVDNLNDAMFDSTTKYNRSTRFPTTFDPGKHHLKFVPPSPNDVQPMTCAAG
jgi:Pentapeptide repeats (8 copies)